MVEDLFNRVKEKGVVEARKLFWIFAYLWVLLGLFALHKSIVLNEASFYHQGFAVINALILAKIIFVAEAFNVADDQAHRPLIYPILYKSFVFALLLIVFHVLEEVLKEMWHGKVAVDSISAQGLEQTIVLSVIMFVVLMPFFALREIARDVGDDKLFEQFFLRRSRYVPLQF